MRKFIIIIFILLYGCTNALEEKKPQLNINFSENLTIEEFKLKLDKYVENSSYPNIDN